jgi:hypothetical protein
MRNWGDSINPADKRLNEGLPPDPWSRLDQGLDGCHIGGNPAYVHFAFEDAPFADAVDNLYSRFVVMDR